LLEDDRPYDLIEEENGRLTVGLSMSITSSLV
jgi:hypothetical protein